MRSTFYSQIRFPKVLICPIRPQHHGDLNFQPQVGVVVSCSLSNAGNSDCSTYVNIYTAMQPTQWQAKLSYSLWWLKAAAVLSCKVLNSSHHLHHRGDDTKSTCAVACLPSTSVQNTGRDTLCYSWMCTVGQQWPLHHAAQHCHRQLRAIKQRAVVWLWRSVLVIKMQQHLNRHSLSDSCLTGRSFPARMNMSATS